MSNFEIEILVRTEGTEVTGERHTAVSNWEEIQAPDGYLFNEPVIRQKDIGWKLIESRGTENYPEFEFSDYVPLREDVPKIVFPKKMKARAHAKSPGGNASGSGMSKIKVFGEYIKY